MNKIEMPGFRWGLRTCIWPTTIFTCHGPTRQTRTRSTCSMRPIRSVLSRDDLKDFYLICLKHRHNRLIITNKLNDITEFIFTAKRKKQTNLE